MPDIKQPAANIRFGNMAGFSTFCSLFSSVPAENNIKQQNKQ